MDKEHLIIFYVYIILIIKIILILIYKIIIGHIMKESLRMDYFMVRDKLFFVLGKNWMECLSKEKYREMQFSILLTKILLEGYGKIINLLKNIDIWINISLIIILL